MLLFSCKASGSDKYLHYANIRIIFAAKLERIYKKFG